MRTTINLDDALLERAQSLSGVNVAAFAPPAPPGAWWRRRRIWPTPFTPQEVVKGLDS